MHAPTSLLVLLTSFLTLNVNAYSLSTTPLAKRDLNQCGYREYCGWCAFLTAEGSTCETYSGCFNGQNICSACGGTCGDGTAAGGNEYEGCPIGSGAATSSC